MQNLLSEFLYVKLIHSLSHKGDKIHISISFFQCLFISKYLMLHSDYDQDYINRLCTNYLQDSTVHYCKLQYITSLICGLNPEKQLKIGIFSKIQDNCHI